MTFDNSGIRRQDRLLDEPRAVELLTEGEYGFLALGGNADEGLTGGYGIPISYVFDGDSIWFHCAPEGEKLKRIAADGGASFCVVGNTRVLPGKFTTLYESVMAFGNIEVVSDEPIRYAALAMLVKKYSPEYVKIGAQYAQKSFARTTILRLRIERISAKSKAL